jgi:hypothetical protein
MAQKIQLIASATITSSVTILVSKGSLALERLLNCTLISC